jgi:hypothetical protein
MCIIFVEIMMYVINLSSEDNHLNSESYILRHKKPVLAQIAVHVLQIQVAFELGVESNRYPLPSVLPVVQEGGGDLVNRVFTNTDTSESPTFIFKSTLIIYQLLSSYPHHHHQSFSFF